MKPLKNIDILLYALVTAVML